MGLILFFFFFYWYGDHRDLHSFPTRRSSDLDTNHVTNLLPSDTAAILLSPNDDIFFSEFSKSTKNIFRTSSNHTNVKYRTHTDSHRSEEHTSELQSLVNFVCRPLLEKKNYYFYNLFHNMLNTYHLNFPIIIYIWRAPFLPPFTILSRIPSSSFQTHTYILITRRRR